MATYLDDWNSLGDSLESTGCQPEYAKESRTHGRSVGEANEGGQGLVRVDKRLGNVEEMSP